jgi:hypothetical protein
MRARWLLWFWRKANLRDSRTSLAICPDKNVGPKANAWARRS